MFIFYKCPNNKNRLEYELQNKSSIQWMKWIELKKHSIETMDYRYKEAYPDFNPKISEHGLQCVGVLDALLPDDVLNSLNENELLLLLLACYVHDIGLVTRKAPYSPLPHENHFENGANFIFQEEWISISTPEKNALAYIIKNHNTVISNKFYKDEIPNELIINNKSIRLKLLIGLLQISDLYHHIIDVVWTNSKELSEKE